MIGVTTMEIVSTAPAPALKVGMANSVLYLDVLETAFLTDSVLKTQKLGNVNAPQDSQEMIVIFLWRQIVMMMKIMTKVSTIIIKIN